MRPQLGAAEERARAQWAHRGSVRPPWAVEPGPGQESVWDYPRPPRLAPDSRPVRVVHEGVLIAESRNAIRVLETASPPTLYIPPTDVRVGLLSRRSRRTSRCEWKGEATYWSLLTASGFIPNVAWSYAYPRPEFARIKGYFSFYPSKLQCYLGEALAEPQAGDFYGGWVTPDVVGPFKGEPGTGGW